MIQEPVGVLCGGPSAEREISIRSGKAVHEALASRGIRAVLVTLSELPDQIPQEIVAAQIGCAFIALHGPFGEDGSIQQILEKLKIPYTGSSVEASRYAMDKVFSRRRWAGAGLDVPRWMGCDRLNAAHRAQRFSFPFMVKPLAQGSSLGISLVDSLQDLAPAVEEACRYGEEILLEEYLPGAELTVGILEDRPLPVIEILPQRRFYDTVAKYTPGMCQYRVPAPLSEGNSRRIQQLALAAHEILGCRSYSRVDMILVPHRGPVLLELNTIPGMTASSLLPKAAAAMGIDFPELCLKILACALDSVEKCHPEAIAR